MAGATMKLPAIGEVKKTHVYVGVAAAGGLIAYAYYRQSQMPPDTAEPGDEPIGTDVPADAAAGGGYGFDYSGSTGELIPGSYPDYRYPSYTAPVYSGNPVSNPEWSDKVQEKMEDRGADSAAVSLAVGRYLAKLCLSEAQADLIRQAIGAVGEPPQGSYSVSVCPASVTPTPTPTPTPTTPKMTAPTGLKATHVTRTKVDLDWNAVKGATGYAMFRDGHRVQSVVYSNGSIASLRANHVYHFSVRAIGPGGVLGPPASKSVRTKR